MNVVQEEQIVLGTQVWAKSRKNQQTATISVNAQEKRVDNSKVYFQGTIISIRREQSGQFQYYVKFEAPELYNRSDWYFFSELQCKGGPSSLFKPPQVADVRNVEFVQLGESVHKTWFFSPYPRPFNSLKTLFVCSRCLKYTDNESFFRKHFFQCTFQVPGIKIYDDSIVNIYEVDGRCEKLFCQLLCLFSKLFLDGKTLFYSTEMFVFYVMTLKNKHTDLHKGTKQKYTISESMVGYFSKEKLSNNILSCIATFPQYMNQGFGTLLIQFAYLLARQENRIAGPEEPLSYLGKLSFQSFWKQKVLQYLVTECIGIFGDISSETLESHYQQEQQQQNQDDHQSPLSMSVSGTKFAFEKDIVDITYDLAMLESHFRLTLDHLKLRIKNDSLIIKEKQYVQLYVQHYKLQKRLVEKGAYYGHKLNEEFMSWEPYPAMFLHNESVVPKHDDQRARQ